MTAELDRRLRVVDIVIRHMIVRVDEELAVAERAKARRKAAMAARRVRRGLPPEPTETELQPAPKRMTTTWTAGSRWASAAGGTMR